MKKLTFNGCSRSPISVTPKNWETKKASIKRKWKIHYRFYDPEFKDDPKLKKGKPVAIRGMNQYSTLEERQRITKALRDNELDQIDNRGYNPITGKFMASEAESSVTEILPSDDFLSALGKAKDKLKYEKETMTDVKCVLRGVQAACNKLFDNQLALPYPLLKISQICTRHIKYILEQCERDNKRFSSRRHNMYRSYLLSLFRECKLLGAIDHNPVLDIGIRKLIKKIPTPLTPEEEKQIDAHLHKYCYRFWRYLMIFFRSGARNSELVSVQKNGKVDLKAQEFIVLVKKGDQYFETKKPIPNDVLPLWQELWDQAKDGQYLFSKNLEPGDKKIRRDTHLRYWHRYVCAPPEKLGLGIKKKFYWLKHLHSDKLEALKGMELAQRNNSHQNPETTGVYTVTRDQRMLNELKATKIPFAAG